MQHITCIELIGLIQNIQPNIHVAFPMQLRHLFAGATIESESTSHKYLYSIDLGLAYRLDIKCVLF